ncbi:type I-B CRISPR-associated protein Cas8b1/Cst1 [Candidatus Woesearchaeota archaeon]|nr:type I-B CRISPR-associated protein Cas8b1/Cst1 [Candidatus Woesearchaeota archaeon]
MTKNIFKFTGNSFVDNGVALITIWAGKKKPEDVEDTVLDDIAKQISLIYTEEAWRNKVQFIFPNSKIANPSIQLSRKSKEYYNLLKTYINNISSFKSDGNCIGCGRRDSTIYLTKTTLPLSGSGDYLNFFPAFEEGEKYCGACAFAIQLSVPMLMDCRKFLLLHSNNEYVSLDLAKFMYERIKTQLSTGNFEGIYKNQYSNERNALFHVIDELIIANHEEIWGIEDTSIVGYFFSNSNRGAELEIFTMPSEVFSFLGKIKFLDKRDKTKNILGGWYAIIGNAWKFKSKKDETFEVKIRKSPNGVYEGLLNGIPIIRYFYNSSEKKALCPWELTELYLSKVRKMEKERIDAIKKLADNIVEIMKSKGNTRRLHEIEGSKYFSNLRIALIKCARDWQFMNKTEPLIKLDDLIQFLFPETSEGYKLWNETRDLILFRIYETSHNWIMENRTGEEKEVELEIEQNGGN